MFILKYKDQAISSLMGYDDIMRLPLTQYERQQLWEIWASLDAVVTDDEPSFADRATAWQEFVAFITDPDFRYADPEDHRLEWNLAFIAEHEGDFELLAGENANDNEYSA